MTEVFILLLLIIVNGLFVMSEIALVSARKSRLESMANKGDLKAKKALELAENPEVFLSAAQIGITLIAIVTGLYSGEKFSDDLRPYVEKFDSLRPYASTLSTTIIVIIVTFLSIIFGELMPKRLGMMQAEKIARLVAGPMDLFSKLTGPIVWLLTTISGFLFRLFNVKKSPDSAVTEEEIKAMITEGSEHGTIEEEEKEIIERVFHLGDRNITSLMTHRTDIEWFDIDDTVQTVKDKFDAITYSTYPVCEKQVDDIKGLIYIKDLLKAEANTPLKDLIKPALFVPENNNPYQLLEKIKETKIHSCFIVNEYGTLEGLITLNDILEAIVGDVPQTGQDEYEVVERADGTYLVDAQIPFYDFLSRFEKTEWMNEGEHEFDTLAGFVLHELEHIPTTGETFDWRGFQFEIIDMDSQRIDKLLVKISEEIKDNMDEE
ncbi:hemolysin family protein [Ferruginibacter lapsinanis]|uniref:hemolysin family protein n=1 Tax=Ferruginibacter lapsinanis TaxID=563172 RepID=UPI001E4DB15E|nr:hemolysin family protein [Ferruginibacter lapsinanis]UEG50033.1 hemolysin family protein [Ferruginibacter lapsinanis]